MEYLIEFILELAFESGLESTKSNKIPKSIIRYVSILTLPLTVP